MDESKLTRAERYALLLYRQGKEKSRALPARHYGDPSNHVEFPSRAQIPADKSNCCVNILAPTERGNMVISEQEISSQAAPERDTPFTRCMKIWASWITLKDQRNVGGWSHPQDAKEFMRTGEAVETMINDLPRVQWWAVRKAHGVAPAVWRFPETSMADALEQAENTLVPKMRNNIDCRRYFY